MQISGNPSNKQTQKKISELSPEKSNDKVGCQITFRSARGLASTAA